MSTPSSAYDPLSRVPLLGGLTHVQLAELAAQARTQTCSAGEPAVHQGDPAESLYLLLEGVLRVYAQDADGHETELRTLSSGDWFGEVALLDGGTRSASVVSVTECRLLQIDRQLVVSTLAARPAMLSNLTATVRANTRRILDEQVQQDLLRTQMEMERYRSMAQLIGRNIARAYALVQQLKKLSVAELSDTLETMNIVGAMEEIVSLFAISVRQSNLAIRVRSTLPESEMEWVGYRGYLSQIVLNLMSNIQRYAYPQVAGQWTSKSPPVRPHASRASSSKCATSAWGSTRRRCGKSVIRSSRQDVPRAAAASAWRSSARL